MKWIQKVREEDYNKTKALLPKELIEKTRKTAEDTAKALGLKIVQPKEQVRAQ